MKSRVMSGMRPTGRLHIGNYFGSLANWLILQEQSECFFGVMDWHALTDQYGSSKEVPPRVRDFVAEWMAWGIDPKRSVVFVQSQVPQHIELFMVFSQLTPMSWLERVPSWKDIIGDATRSDSHCLGRFAYPVLQAADIALYHGQAVPVGKDQLPHLELSREIIRRFNFLYSGTLTEPEAILTQAPLVVGTDGRKMSKSYNNTVYLTEEPDILREKIRTMTTDPQRIRRKDPGDPEKCPVYSYHQLFSTEENLQWVQEGCRSAGIGCFDCKMCLVDNMEALVKEPRVRKKELLNNPEEIDSIIEQGCVKAQSVARSTLQDVKQSMGLLPSARPGSLG